MKILIFSSFGRQIPDFVINFWTETGDTSRFGEIIDKIEAEAVPAISGVSVTDIRRHPDSIYHSIYRHSYQYHNKNGTESINSVTTYVGWCSAHNNVASVDIVDYDETKRHIISDYDGSETLECLDNYICIDKEHNIWSESQS